MLAFCRREGIPHDVCGKVVVATRETELPALEELLRRGTANDVAGLEVIGRERLRELEPLGDGLKAIHVPGTAITDYVAVTRRMASIAKGSGVEVRTGARVIGLKRRGAELVVETTAGELAASHAVNCAGLHSDRIARMAGANPGVIIVPFRGEYYELGAAKRSMVRGLIYPVPDPSLPFLGVHLTRRVNGEVEAGPNAVLALRREGYHWGSFRLQDAMETLAFAGFWKMARRYWRTGLDEMHRSISRRAFLTALQRLAPSLRDEDLEPGGAGVRAQAMDRTGKLVDDFQIEQGEGMIHVLNVPSPAATASLAIGQRILEMMERSFGLSAADRPASTRAT